MGQRSASLVAGVGGVIVQRMQLGAHAMRAEGYSVGFLVVSFTFLPIDEHVQLHRAWNSIHSIGVRYMAVTGEERRERADFVRMIKFREDHSSVTRANLIYHAG